MATLQDFYTDEGITLMQADAALHRVQADLYAAVRTSTVARRRIFRRVQAREESQRFKALSPLKQGLTWLKRELNAAIERPDPMREMQDLQSAEARAAQRSWAGNRTGSLAEVARLAGRPELAHTLVKHMVEVFRLMHEAGPQLSTGDDLDIMHKGVEGPRVRMMPSATTVMAIDELLGIGPRGNYRQFHRYNLSDVAGRLEALGPRIRFTLARDILDWQSTVFSPLRNRYWRIADRIVTARDAASAELAVSKSRVRLIDQVEAVARQVRDGGQAEALVRGAFGGQDLRAIVQLVEDADSTNAPWARELVTNSETIADAIGDSDHALRTWASSISSTTATTEVYVLA